MPITDSRPIWDASLAEILSQPATPGTHASATDIPGVNLEWMATDAYPAGAWFGDCGQPTLAQLYAIPTAYLAFDARASANGVQYTYGAGGWVAVGGLSRSAQTSIVNIGDSISAYGKTTYGPSVQSIPAWALGSIGIGYNIASTRAVGGATLQSVISGQLANAVGDDAEIAWVHGGINNLNPSIDATIPTVEEIAAMMDLIAACLSSAKKLVIIDSVTPLNPGSSSGSLPRAGEIPTLNGLYEAIALKYSNVIFNDCYTPLWGGIDPGIAKDGVNVPDGIHLNGYGAYLAGTSGKAAIVSGKTALKAPNKAIACSVFPQLVGTTGTKTPSTGTINGSVPTNYTLAITANASNVVVTASVGVYKTNSARIRIVNSGASECTVVFKPTQTWWLSSLVTGEFVRARARIHVVSGQVGLRLHDFQLQFNGNATYVTQSMGAGSTAATEQTPTLPAVDYDVMLSTPVYGMPANYASTLAQVIIKVAPGGDVTLDIADLAIEKVT